MAELFKKHMVAVCGSDGVDRLMEKMRLRNKDLLSRHLRVEEDRRAPLKLSPKRKSATPLNEDGNRSSEDRAGAGEQMRSEVHGSLGAYEEENRVFRDGKHASQQDDKHSSCLERGGHDVGKGLPTEDSQQESLHMPKTSSNKMNATELQLLKDALDNPSKRNCDMARKVALGYDVATQFCRIERHRRQSIPAQVSTKAQGSKHPTQRLDSRGLSCSTRYNNRRGRATHANSRDTRNPEHLGDRGGITLSGDRKCLPSDSIRNPVTADDTEKPTHSGQQSASSDGRKSASSANSGKPAHGASRGRGSPTDATGRGSRVPAREVGRGKPTHDHGRVMSAPLGSRSGKPTYSYDEIRKKNAAAYEEELKKQREQGPSASFGRTRFLTDRSRDMPANVKRVNNLDGQKGITKRHPRNFGGDTFDRVHASMSLMKHQGYSQGGPKDITLSMTGEERLNYTSWKQEQDAIEAERLRRAKTAEGGWKREWDQQKTESRERERQQQTREQKPFHCSGSKSTGSGDFDGPIERQHNAPKLQDQSTEPNRSWEQGKPSGQPRYTGGKPTETANKVCAQKGGEHDSRSTTKEEESGNSPSEPWESSPEESWADIVERGE